MEILYWKKHLQELVIWNNWLGINSHKVLVSLGKGSIRCLKRVLPYFYIYQR